jgi:hypothetical protein
MELKYNFIKFLNNGPVFVNMKTDPTWGKKAFVWEFVRYSLSLIKHNDLYGV